MEASNHSAVPELASIWQLLELRRPALAETAARHRLATDPADGPTLLALTEALRQLNRLPEAREAAQAAIRRVPEAAEAHYALALVRGQLGQLRETVAAVDEALRLAPHRAQYYGYRAQLFCAQRRYPDAIKCAEAGLRIDPQQPTCLLWRALAQEATDQPDAADQDFARLLRVAPESEVVHSRLGQLLLKRFEPQAAERHLAEALRQAPEEAPRLVPLLQQARQQATWPGWLLRNTRQEVEARALGIGPGLKAVLVRLAILVCTLRANWLLRHDPVFQALAKPPLVRPWASTPLVWVGLVGLVAAFIYVNATQHLRAGPTIFMLTIFALRYMYKRQENNAGAPHL